MDQGRKSKENKDRHFNKDKVKGITGCVLLAAGFALLWVSRIFRGFADWYSTYIYSAGVNTVGRAVGYVPFSVSEVLLYLLAALLVLRAGSLGVAVVRKYDWKKTARSRLANLILLVGLLFFSYVVNCGINYYRETFSESAGFAVETYSVKELKEVCLWLPGEVNESSRKVKRDPDGVMTLQDISPAREAAEAMKSLGRRYPELSGYYPRPKGLLAPWILSVQNLTGVYSPFTVEANYNSGMTDYNIPFTACHELSHLRGFMEEKEANFIGFLACRESESEEFRYSGNLMGWIYCMNVLYRSDYDAWEEVRGGLAKEAEADLKANWEFWAEYDGAVAEVANRVNDTYLKANGQSEGVESYDRMVDLIVWHFMQEEK